MKKAFQNQDISNFTLESLCLTEIISKSTDILCDGNETLLTLLYPKNMYNLTVCDQSIALLTTFIEYECFGNPIVKNFHEYITEVTLNYLIDKGRYKGHTVAYNLMKNEIGIKMLCYNNFKLAKLISANTLNHVVLAKLYIGESVAFHMVTPQDDKRTQDLVYKLHEICKFPMRLSEYTLNAIVEDSGLSIAYLLSTSTFGRYTLLLNNDRLLDMLDKEAVNRIPRYLMGLSNTNSCNEGTKEVENAVYPCIPPLPYHLLTSGSCTSFFRENFLIAIHEDTLNFSLHDGEFANQTIIYLILENMIDCSKWNYFLRTSANGITERSLNLRVDASGTSTAFWFAKNTYYSQIRNLFAYNNYRLLKLINPESLNQRVSCPQHRGLSVAFYLAYYAPEMFYLGGDSQIVYMLTAETFNHIIGSETGDSDNFTDLSVAYCLLSCNCSDEISKHFGSRLTSIINEHVLNHIIVKTGFSTLYGLVAYYDTVGRDMLCASDFKLAGMIGKCTLNHIVEDAEECGLSVAYWLAGGGEVGREILAHNNYRLAMMINKYALNHIVGGLREKGLSVVYWLCKSSTGHAILSHNDFYLANMISTDALNHVVEGSHENGRSAAYCLVHGGDSARSILMQRNGHIASMIDDQMILDPW